MEAASLSRRVKLFRFLLPLLIFLLVLLVEFLLRSHQVEPWIRWVRVAFYGLLGPLVTYLTLEWIAQQVHSRESAQESLAAANRHMACVGELLKLALSAENLEQALSQMAKEVAESLGAEASITYEGIHARAASSQNRPGGQTAWSTILPFSPPDELGESPGGLEIRLARPPSLEEEQFLQVLTAELAGALGGVRARTLDMLTVFDVDEDLRAEANLDRLLERLLERILGWAQARAGGVLLLDPDGFIRPRVTRGLSSLSQPFVPEGRWKEALAAPGFVEDNLLALPLKGQSPIGLLLVEGEAEKLRQQLSFLRFLASQVASAVRNAQAYLRAEELALTEERNRIAREIHDGLAQSLAFMALKLDLAERLLTSQPERALVEVATVKNTLRTQIREVRRSLFALRPLDLERYGFLESVKRYTEAFAEQAGFRLRLGLPEQVSLSHASELVIFRVLQESLTNAVKHGSPALVEVRLEARGERGATLEVTDNGKGFDPQEKARAGFGGFGLTQMKERLEARGGSFRVESEPGRGTKVRAELPY